MADLLSFSDNVTVDSNGDPVSGAQARFFESGTTTPITVYTTEVGDIAHPTPLVADGDGVFPAAFHTGSTNVRVVVVDADGADLPGYPKDIVTKTGTNTSGAGQTSFQPSALLPASNLQDALDFLAARVGTVTELARALLDDPDTATMRLTMGLGNASRLGAANGFDFNEDPNAAAPRSVIKGFVDTFVGVGIDPQAQWRDMTAERAANTAYQNITEFVLPVSVRPSTLGADRRLESSTNGTDWIPVAFSGGQETFQQYGLIMPYHFYQFTGDIGHIAELRRPV